MQPHCWWWCFVRTIRGKRLLLMTSIPSGNRERGCSEATTDPFWATRTTQLTKMLVAIVDSHQHLASDAHLNTSSMGHKAYAGLHDPQASVESSPVLQLKRSQPNVPARFGHHSNVPDDWCSPAIMVLQQHLQLGPIHHESSDESFRLKQLQYLHTERVVGAALCANGGTQKRNHHLTGLLHSMLLGLLTTAVS
eukprot:GHVS01105208.1.p2 GENE.GHVS01105208.1~~GHVS01105208.1.p2  ORF type:complete len:194 (-),score=26.33 GHVS01105208.1:79-660(-)